MSAENDKLTSKDFLEFVQSTPLSKHDLDAVNALIGKRIYVLGSSFYNVLQLLKLDIDQCCEHFFANNHYTELYQEVDSENKLVGLLGFIVKDTTKISRAANIENTRLSRLLNGKFTNLYPSEVYNLAKSLRIDPSVLFHYLYGKGMRPEITL